MVQTVLPYHRVMCPKWIHSNAVITGPFALYPQYFEILPTTGAKYQRALQVQLIAPNILTSTDSVTVTVTVALDTTLPDNNDHDILFGISDGVSFFGFQAIDKRDYPTWSPCAKFEGKVVQTTLQNRQLGNGPLVTSQKYSSEIKLQIKPTEKWGSCHTEHDGGYVIIHNYQSSFDLTKALYFEVYRDTASEKYRIKYIVVGVDLN